MTATKRPNLYVGPSYKDDSSPTGWSADQYDLNDDDERQAWEDAWADHLGKQRETIERTVKRDRFSTQQGEVVLTPEQIERKKRFAEAVEHIASYTGTFGLILDLKADRRFGSAHFTLSDRQIDAVLASKAREAQWAAERANAPQRPSTRGTGAVTTITQDGFYKHGDLIVKVQVAVHGSGNLYAKVLTVQEYGRATWEYTPGLVRQLTEDERLTHEQAVEFGRLYGVCCICGRTLTNEDSIEAGIGPICAGRAGW